ncbi:hypothetical protein ROA7023_01813 [Roseisalinus antarcticus]|uniref:Uncharacterized protein n=2 Tax=Roseisalinus antarcticus TaxID=254357 RepID=A0A1Y5SMI2_9RHOB|nr:hypothetical protein ROA7023_01813 [Roseisalinus antarcticus]
MTVAIALAMMVLSLAAGLFDERTLGGASVWSKPTKFNFSFAVHIATLMVFLSLLQADLRKSKLITSTMLVTCAAVLLELGYVGLQAARGRASHFNQETPWEELAYYAMGAAVAVVLLGTLVIGLTVWRRPVSQVGPGLRLGVGLGTLAGTLATLATAGAMSSMQFTPTGHWVGGDLTDAGGLPILGWSTTGGDLRVPHFFATHLLQALPVAGWLADRSGLAFPRVVPLVAAVAGLAIVWFTFQQAMSGQPVIGWNTARSP